MELTTDEQLPFSIPQNKTNKLHVELINNLLAYSEDSIFGEILESVRVELRDLMEMDYAELYAVLVNYQEKINAYIQKEMASLDFDLDPNIEWLVINGAKV